MLSNSRSSAFHNKRQNITKNFLKKGHVPSKYTRDLKDSECIIHNRAMDYVVGSVAALISGNVTPNRPRLIRRALTPTKHQPSPNVTPKSEAVDDRSIFLSPTLQKKKAIVKKSPKRIFQNPDLDTTANDNDTSVVSPKAEKVKKHLKDELEADAMPKMSPVNNKSLKNKRNRTSESEVPEIKLKDDMGLNIQVENESTPKKKKKKKESVQADDIKGSNEVVSNETSEQNSDAVTSATKSPKRTKQRRKSIFEDTQSMETENTQNTDLAQPIETDPKPKTPKKNDKIKETPATDPQIPNESKEGKDEPATPKKKKNKRKNKTKAQNHPEVTQDHETDKENQTDVNNDKKKKKRKKKKSTVQNPVPAETEKLEAKTESNKVTNKKSKKSDVNPNAITNKDSDSEHESDDDIESENEEINKKVLQTEPPDSSSDEEEDKPKEPKKKVQREAENDAEVLKRTLFVGNVPFSKKCKKEIKKIFNKYGQIETIRIRTVPVKDARTTPKLAVIKKELHPERSTVNVYIKYADIDSVEKALSENNTVLNDHHLRVSRSDSTGAEHDPKCSVFVGNLPFALEDEVLRAKFEKCGEIDSVRIIRDKKTNAGKGFGYINFKSKDGVELALTLSEEDLTIKNRILRVKRCTQNAHRKQPAQRREFKKFEREGDRFNQPPKEEGAFRRIMNKRKFQDGSGDGPPDKRQRNLVQPSREKKPRKEFVGMTAEKKKKRKFDKGQKKKKALSEILTK